MNKRNRIILVLSMTLIFLYGCIASDKLEITIVPSREGSIQTQRNTAKQTLIPSLSSQTAIPTYTTTPFQIIKTSTIMPATVGSSNISQSDDSIPSCKNNGIPDSITNTYGLDGVIIYPGINHNGIYSVGGLPLTYSTLPILETQKYDIMGFSLNGRWLAYSIERINFDDPFDNPSISLLGYDGTKIEHVIDISAFKPFVPEGAKIIGWGGKWINNELLSIGIAYQFTGGTEWIGTLGGLLDPFQGRWLNINLPVPIADTPVGFSPDMTRVLYPTENGVILWDLVQEKELWTDSRGFGLGPPGYIYDWALDSSIAAYMYYVDRDLFLVSRDGDIAKKVTDLASPASSTTFSIESFKFSPNSLFLAIIINKTADDSDMFQPTLYIYDISHDKYIYQCPFYNYKIAAPIDIYWSPDGNYLVPVNPNWSMPVLIFDIRTRQVIELIKEAGLVEGWSDQFPALWP